MNTRVYILTVSGDPDQKVYLREENIQAIFPSKDGGCLLYLEGGVQVAVNEPVHEAWEKAKTPSPNDQPLKKA